MSDFWVEGRQLGRYFWMAMWEVDPVGGEPVIEGRVDIRDAMRAADGSLGAGTLLTLADSIGGMCAGLAELPKRWVVSTNLTLRVARPEAAGPIRLRTWILRKGRASVVNAVEMYDEADKEALVATAVLTSAALVPEFEPPAIDRPVVVSAPSPPRGDTSLRSVIGAYEVDAGPGADVALAMNVTDAIRNPWGIVHGGAIVLLMDAVVESALGGPVVAGDTVVHFLRPGRVGPVHAEARITGTRADGAVLRITWRDAGAGGRTTALGSTVARGA